MSRQAAAAVVVARYSSLRCLAGSADRRCVLNSALVPELIEASGDLQRRTGTDVAIEGFAIVARRLDDADDPILGQAELFAEIAVGSKDPFQLRLIRLRHLIDVSLSNAKLFGIHHCE